MTVILGKNSKTAIYLRRRKRGEVLSVSRKCLLDKYLASLEVFLRKKKMAWIHVDECFATD